MITLYNQVKTSIDFLCRRGSNPSPFFFFLIGNQIFNSKKGHHVRNGEHSELKTNISTSGRDTNKKKKFRNGNTLCKTPNFTPSPLFDDKRLII